MTLATIELCPAGDAHAALVILHGLGADGADFIPICDALDLKRHGPVRCIMPRAPERAVTINRGMRMRAWYDIRGEDLRDREDEAGLRASVRDVHALIAREVARGVAARRIVLAGFSQGCALTLLAGLRYPERLAGLAGLSGYLPLAQTTAAERTSANRDVPIFLAHGRDDGVVPIARGSASRDALVALGHDVEWHDYAIEHSVCIEEVKELDAWLQRVWA